MRGIGVAVMCSACGARPSGALASSAARWRTPKRCCSSTTHSGQVAELHRRPRSARACPPPASSSPPASRAEQLAPPRGGRRAGQQLDRDEAAEQPVERRPGAARRASPWAPSARPGGRSRRRAASRRGRRTVLPEPTSPISSRCIGRSGREVGVDLGDAPRAGRPSARTGATAARVRPARRSARAGAAAAPSRRARRAPRHRELEQEELLEGEPLAGARVAPPRRRGSARRPPRPAGRPAARPRGARPGSGSDHMRGCAPKASQASLRSAAALMPLGGRVERHADRVPGAGASEPESSSCSLTQNWLRSLRCP